MLLQASLIYGILVGCRIPPTSIPQHHSPPNEVKERGGGLFEDIIPIHTCLHFRGIPMRHAVRFKGTGRMYAAVSQ